jgi:hypothetical protein
MHRSALALCAAVLVTLATAGMVLAAGSVPHVHVADEPAYFNEEHDLSLLAGLAGQLTVDRLPALAMDDVSALVLPLLPARRAVLVAPSAESRAPPAR